MNARLLTVLALLIAVALGGAAWLLSWEDTGGGDDATVVGRPEAAEGIDVALDGLEDGAAPQPRVDGLGTGEAQALTGTHQAAALVSGRVVDRAGLAREGAEVRPLTARADLSLDGASHAALRQRPLASAVPADAEGRFLLPGLPTGQPLTLEVHAPGAAPLMVDLAPLTEGETRDLGDLVLQTGMRLLGHVRDSEGQPLPDAVVRVLDVALSEAHADTPREVARAQTDAQGFYEIPHLAPRQFSIEASREGYGPVVSVLAFVLGGPGPEWTQDFTLDPANRNLAGLVRSAMGDPLADVELRLVQRSKSSSAQFFSTQGRTDAQGRFLIATLPAGLFDVTLSHPEWYADGPVRLHTDRDGHEIVLHPALTVTGRLSVASGDPPARFSVTVRPDGRTGARLLPGAAVTRQYDDPDDPGNFRFGGLRPGAYRFQVSAPGFAPTTSQDVIMGPGQRGAEVVINLVRGARLVGRVTDALGDATGLEGSRIELRDLDYDPSLAIESTFPTPPLPGLVTRTDDEGRFRMENVPVGRYVVTARPPGQPAVHLRDVPLYDGETTDVGTLVVEAGGHLAGQVLGLDSRPVAGATVRVTGDSFHTQVKTRSDGRFQLSALPTGAYELQATPPGLFDALKMSAADRVVVRARETTEIELLFTETRLDRR